MSLSALRASSLIVLSLSVCIESHAAQFMPLGDLPGGEIPSSSAIAISSNGMFVVGESTTGGLYDDSPYIWSESSGLVSLGTPPGRFSSPNAVTDDGEFVVGTHRIEQPSLYAQAFTWKQSTGMEPLAGLPAGAFITLANDVTPDGEFIVGESSVGIGSATGPEAFRISRMGELIGLGNLSAEFTNSSANAVSADGSVIVGMSSSQRGYQAFVWTQSTGMFGLGDIPDEHSFSMATDVSADGAVVIGYGNISSAPHTEAFRWTASDGLKLLGSIPSFSDGSFALGVSGDGSVIVGGARGDGTTPEPGPDIAPFVWDSLHGMRNLQNVLRDDYSLAAQLEGWRLYEAADISADGRSIIGIGRNPDRNLEGWLVRLDRPLTAPEPGTLTLFLAGVASLARARRRHAAGSQPPARWRGWLCISDPRI